MNKPIVQLSGTDGNIFSIIGKVYKALNKSNLPDQAKEFAQKAGESKSYDEVLYLCSLYVEVQ